MTDAIPGPRSSAESTLPLPIVNKSASNGSKMATFHSVKRMLRDQEEKELAIYRDILYCVEWLAEDEARIIKAEISHCLDPDSGNCAHTSHFWNPVAHPCLTSEIAAEARGLYDRRKKAEDDLARHNTRAALAYKATHSAKHSRKRQRDTSDHNRDQSRGQGGRFTRAVKGPHDAGDPGKPSAVKWEASDAG